MRKFQKEQAENFIQLLGEAHEEIRANIEKKNYEPVLVTLADCQDGAIALGNLLEVAEGENCTTIPLLEKYCELVFRIHTDISEGGYVDALKTDRSLRKALTQIENSVRNDIKVRKEIAFFPYNASMWDSLESVYLAAKEDQDCDAYCVPIPYFEKRADGKLGQAHYEGAEYPKNIEITDWQTYNFEERRPDVMYIHNPYDASNRVTCVHPRFFSSNLKKYTDELVYIPYFVGPEIDPKDQAAIERMKHFCFLPGVIHADKVILQSENHRQVYIAEYSKAAKQFGLEAKHTDPEYLEEKFLALGSPKFDKVLRTKKEDIDIPDEWIRVIKKPDGSFKKIVFYNTSIQALLIHKEQMLKKMKHVLETFKENKDEVALLWRPHPLLESTIKSMLPQLWEEYDALTRKYREEGWGIWDDTKDMNRAVALSDAYYGDSSSVLQVYQKTGKPIMVQNVDWEYEPVKLNVTDAKIIGNEVWMIVAESNFLYCCDLLTDKMERYELPIDFKKIGNYRVIEKVENYLYLIPSKSNELVLFNLYTKQFKVIKLLGNGFYATVRYQQYLFLFGTFEPIVNRINIDDTGYVLCYNLSGYKRLDNMKKRDNYLEERATKYIYQYIKYEHVNKYIAEYFRKKLVYRYGIWIGRDCKIGEGLTLPHPQGIVIGNGVHIGKNVTLFQQVTLGKNQGGYPYIESGTTIYPGARVIGKIRIGRNTVIGTQAVVMQSTEMNSIYAGVPAKRIK